MNYFNTPYLLALHSINGLGPRRLKAILDYFKDPKLAWEADAQEFYKVGIPKNIIEILLQTRKTLEPESYAESIQKSGIKWLTILDKNYPNLLKEIYDPPAVLYYKGEINDWNKSSIAVVGSRKISGYGKVVTAQFTQGLANAGLTIVSGLASGVDSQAHLSAVLQEGKTIAVLGGGLNRIFPYENRSLTEKITAGYGAVISEFLPDASPLPGNFPVRNRIISGLSLGVLVIEAAENSGSLITAKLALEQGREVFAVPGPVTSNLSKGPVSLIREGAKAVFSPDEVLEELGVSSVNLGSKDQSKLKISEEEKRVLQSLENENLHIDEIGRCLQLPSAKISVLLLKMEISGLVVSIGAGIYCKR
ncbi:DNA-protecting protein DprA [Candidatus Daviesbacteria bacterium]|nr:DNA-protecting protein DprA [Candidatus Daviesbacteria bacterium]